MEWLRSCRRPLLRMPFGSAVSGCSVQLRSGFLRFVLFGLGVFGVFPFHALCSVVGEIEQITYDGLGLRRVGQDVTEYVPLPFEVDWALKEVSEHRP
jgi:hypothetical protein